MISLSKGLFTLLGLVYLGAGAAVSQIKIAPYEGTPTGIDTIIYIGQDVPDIAPADVSGFTGLNADLKAFKEVRPFF